MSFLDLVRAEMRMVYGDMMRRKAMLAMFIAYPYVLTLFFLLIGYALGSPRVFAARVGVRPEIFFIVGGFITMTILGVGDDILWRPMFDEWMGTLPYIIASPVSRIQHYLAIPLPRLVLVLISGSTTVVPVLAYYYGVPGLLDALTILGLTALAAVFYAAVALVITGLLFGMGGEHWRLINVVRPFLIILVGAYYPRYLLPLSARILSYMVPSSHPVEVAQRLLVGGVEAGYALMLLGVATALFLLYMPAGLRSIVFWEKKKVAEGVKT